ncbi:MAG: DNA repair protein RecN [Ruminococcaceae bacterium]|nr:DNA repair protein RecN [Oscillospiraceae bacterium]
MISSLHVENIATIKSADIDLASGFCVLTGETGAGKSILVDSIALLLGGRLSKELVRAGESYALVSAVFCNVGSVASEGLSELGITVCEEDGGEIMLERRITSDGRSTARINGRTVTVSLLREVGGLLVNIHGQNDNREIMQKTWHLKSLDAYADCDDLLAEYGVLYSQWRSAEEKLNGLMQDESERLRLREMLEYQINDIDSARLKVGEEEKLTAQRDRLLHQEKINKGVRIVTKALTDSDRVNAKELVERAVSAAEQLAEFDVIPECESVIERLTQVKYELIDISEAVRSFAGDDDFDVSADSTALIDKIEGRLDTINRLSRKYGADIAEILAFRDRAAQRLDEIDSADERITEYTKNIKRAEAELCVVGGKLTARRRSTAVELAEKIRESLTFLDMPKVRFEISVKPTGRFTSDGVDDVEFLVSANPGEPPAPMTKIASGGELSRIMLALRSVLNDKYGMYASIYDEVDTGISGRTSRKVGIKLRDISLQSKDFSQVICVTHSAQIASLADAHYLIEKREEGGRAHTSVRRLSEDERVEEIARILGGLDVSDAQRAAARELISER